MKKALKISLIILPLVAGGGIAYYYWRRRIPVKRELPSNVAAAIVSTASASQVASVPNCTYPLQKGVRNECVRQLQNAIVKNFGGTALPRFGADADWGTETESAMLLYVGKNKINSANDLANTIESMTSLKEQNSTVVNTVSTKAISDAGSGIIKHIVCLDNTPWQEMKLTRLGGILLPTDNINNWENSYDNGLVFEPTIYALYVRPGLKLSTADYRILKRPNSDNGYLMIECIRGENKGFWAVNPVKIRLQ